MVVWTDDFDTIIPLAREFEEKLIKLVWKNRLVFSAPSSAQQCATATSSDFELNEKTGSQTPEPTARDRAPKKSKWRFGWKLSSEQPAVPKVEDPEKGVLDYVPRRMRMFAPFHNGLGCALSICALSPFSNLVLSAHPFSVFIGSGINIMLQEFVLDPTYNRFGLLATAPFLVCVSIVSDQGRAFTFLLSF